MNLPILEVSCTWNHTAFVLCLAYGGQRSAFKAHPRCNGISSSFLFTAEQYFTVRMDHILFSHLFTDT